MFGVFKVFIYCKNIFNKTQYLFILFCFYLIEIIETEKFRLEDTSGHHLIEPSVENITLGHVMQGYVMLRLAFLDSLFQCLVVLTVKNSYPGRTSPEATCACCFLSPAIF